VVWNKSQGHTPHREAVWGGGWGGGGEVLAERELKRGDEEQKGATGFRGRIAGRWRKNRA